jgi:hypothetical protein
MSTDSGELRTMDLASAASTGMDKWEGPIVGADETHINSVVEGINLQKPEILE